MMKHLCCWVCLGALLLGNVSLQGQGLEPAVPEILGINAARQRWGDRMPIGRGIVFGHVEGDAGHYTPHLRDPAFKGVHFTLESGPSQPFGHTDATCKIIYGPRGLAPGVHEVHLFTTGHWLGSGYLRLLEPFAPAISPIRVFTQSWVALDHPRGPQILRRVDYQIDQHDVIFCVGVNNGRQSQVPQLLASAYNVIAVGTNDANGASSGGYTRGEQPGRCKPDIVGPRGLTSFTTPTVAACVGRLLEAADRMPVVIQHAQQSEVIKAVLMAGAVKPWGWRRGKNKPLDEHRGAGVVQLDNSLRILQAGSTPPGTVTQKMGWDFHALSPGEHATYTFTANQVQRPLSVMLVWNRHVAGQARVVRPGTPAKWDGPATLADFDLALSGLDRQGQARLIQVSRSRIDNVEHVYLPQLPPGRYRLDVVRQRDGQPGLWDYALAWRRGGTFDPQGPSSY